jgi:hypothetical protein
MNKKEKLHLAKQSYDAVSKTIRGVESYLDARVNCMWHGCISVDGTVFGPDELKDDAISALYDGGK